MIKSNRKIIFSLFPQIILFFVGCLLFSKFLPPSRRSVYKWTSLIKKKKKKTRTSKKKEGDGRKGEGKGKGSRKIFHRPAIKGQSGLNYYFPPPCLCRIFFFSRSPPLLLLLWSLDKITKPNFFRPTLSRGKKNIVFDWNPSASNECPIN